MWVTNLSNMFKWVEILSQFDTSQKSAIFFPFYKHFWALCSTQQYEGKSFFYIEWKLIETDRCMCLEIASRTFCCMCCQEIKNIFVSAVWTLLVRNLSKSTNKQRYRWNSRSRNKIVLLTSIHNLDYKNSIYW